MNMLLVENQKEYIYIYIYIYKLLALHGASLPNVKYFRNKQENNLIAPLQLQNNDLDHQPNIRSEMLH